MDVLFHGLTGLAISKAFTGKYYLSVSIFSMLPDLGSGFFQYLQVKDNSKKSGKRLFSEWMAFIREARFFNRSDRVLCRAGHSFFSTPIVALITYIFFQPLWWIQTVGFVSHLLIDLPVHHKETALRPLWPLHDVYIKGKNWAQDKRLFFSFWMALIIVFLFQMVF